MFDSEYRSQTSALLFSGTSKGVEQSGFQSSVSLHGVELWPFSVRVLVLEPNKAKYIVTRLVRRSEISRLTS